ncbi:hypothetical protein P9112_004575 [Eukaryota sp. TZLM1-RC]
MSKNQEPYEIVTSEDQLSSLLSSGTVLIELFSPTWGRCTSIVATVKRWKVDYLGKDIKFLLVDTNVINQFGQCGSCPRFLVFHNGEQVHDFEGLNVPHIQSTLEELMD